ncbi:AP-5 complex subunit zeta-1-like isoform X2 [Dysidea avara]
MASLSFISTAISHIGVVDTLAEGHKNTISSLVGEWLATANTSCVANPSSSSGLSLFSSGARKQMVLVKELDGTGSQDIFTVLSIGPYYSTDQLLNVISFSMLRQWLPVVYPARSHISRSHTPVRRPMSSQAGRSPMATPTTPDRGRSPAIATPTSFNKLLTPIGPRKRELKHIAVQYCLRILDQWERKPPTCPDDDVIKACLHESIMMLDLLCDIDHSFIPAVFPAIKKVFTQVSQDPTQVLVPVMLSFMTFFLHHGKTEVYDPEPAVHSFFTSVLPHTFQDPSVAFEVVNFCVSNLATLRHTSKIFTKYFPGLLKILAWYPQTFIAEFLQLLPAFLSEHTTSEVLHSVLDLPCLSAVLQLQHYSLLGLSEQGACSAYVKSITAFCDPTFKLMFGHFLRDSVGRGDTIDKLGQIHALLMEFSSHARVIAAAEVVPLLLRLYFRTVLTKGSRDLVSSLIPVILERVVQLSHITSYQSEVRDVLSEQVLLMFKAYPTLIVDHCSDITDFVTLRNLSQAKEEFFLHTVWLIGEYASSSYDSRCTTRVLVKFHECLESVAYEVSMTMQTPGQQGKFSTRLMLVLMGSLAKIASRCQDLIPRVLLCLNKIVQHEQQLEQAERRVMLTRASELVNILKMPSVALAVLSPPACSPQQTVTQTQTSLLLQAISHFNKTHTPTNDKVT